MGATTIYGIEMGAGGITGLGVPRVKTTDLSYTDRDGSYGGVDRLDVRVITVPLIIRGATATAAMDGLEAMNTAWAVSAVDIPLYMRLPGFGKFYVNGRPRGLDADLKDMQFGAVHALATFVCPNPTITYV